MDDTQGQKMFVILVWWSTDISNLGIYLVPHSGFSNGKKIGPTKWCAYQNIINLQSTISSISLHNPTNLNAMIFISFSLIHSVHFAVTGLKVGKLVFRNIKENCGLYQVTFRLKKREEKGRWWLCWSEFYRLCLN